MPQARALILGAGQAGLRHAEALRELGIPFTGPLSSRDVARDPSPIRDRQIQVVHVCSANDLHAPLVTEAFSAEKDVICEKPLTHDVATADDLEARGLRSGRLAIVAYNYRFHPMLIEFAARVAAGELGTIHDVRGSFLQDWLLLSTDDNWRVDAARGGASRVVADIGVHWLDIVEVITGRKVESVAAQVGRLHDRATEDHGGLLMRFAGGLAGTCVLSQGAAGHRNDVEVSIDGSRASVTWRSTQPDELWIGQRDGARVVKRDGDLISPAARRLAALPAGPNAPRRDLFAAFYARLAGDERPPAAPLATFADGARHIRFAAAALASARELAWIDIA